MSEVDRVNAVSEAEAEAIFSGDADAMVALFTEDCVIMAPSEPQKTGHDGVRAWHDDLVSEFEVSGGYTDTDVTVLGDTAIQRYYAEMQLTPRAGGDPATVSMKGLHVMKRQDNGEWKIWQDIWNPDAA